MNNSFRTCCFKRLSIIRSIGLLLLLLQLSSCATIFNGPTKRVRIAFEDPEMKVVYLNDTLEPKESAVALKTPRQKDSLRFTIFNDTIQREVKIPAQNSLAYILNFTIPGAPGVLFDRKTPKRYNYPGLVYIEVSDSNTRYYPYPKPRVRKNFILKVTPSRLVNIHPGVEMALEKVTSKHFSSQLSLSYLLPNTFWDENLNPQRSGYRIALEERYFKNEAPAGKFLAFEIDYLHVMYRESAGFGIDHSPLADTANYLDTVTIARQILTFNLKLGYQVISNRFTLEIFAGLGLRYRAVEHYHQLNPEDDMIPPRHPNINYETARAGRYWNPNITAGFRVGYVL